MKMTINPLVLAGFCAAALVGCDEVRVSEAFGYDPVDSTRFLQAALDSDAKTIVIDRQADDWYVTPLLLKGAKDKTIVFEDGAYVRAKRGEFKSPYIPLIRFEFCTNVTVRGVGPTRCGFRMWREDYATKRGVRSAKGYEWSEWRHCISLLSTVGMRLEGICGNESGGDGLYISNAGRKKSTPGGGPDCVDTVVRNCVFDRNYRQGISVIGSDGLLIEDTVMSNTGGTDPQAGIDLEPNNPENVLRRVVVRNARSVGNAGSGFEAVFHHSTQASVPADLRFENCVSRGNLTGAVVIGNHVREHDIVRGDIAFANCSFEEDRSRGIRVTGVPRGTLNVRFDGCTVVGNAGSKSSDVLITSVGAMQGLPDHVEFNGLKVVKRNGEDWFFFAGSGVGQAPSAVRGDVTVVSTNGTTDRIALDAEWAKGRFPIVNGGKVVPPMKPFPEFKDVTAVETKPGEMADLAPIGFASYARRCLLLVPRPMTVRIAARTTGKKGGADEKVEICRILPGGGRPSVASVRMPGPEGGEIVFDVKQSPGFYTMKLPTGSSACCLERSNVPIALDLTGWSPLVKVLERRPFSLWFHVPADGHPFAAYACEGGWSRFAADFRDPDGKVFASGDSKGTHVVIADVPTSQSKAGLWSIDFRGIPKCGGFDELRVATGNLPGYFFLSCEKYWK